MIRFSVSGLAGSGKDTLADILCEKFNYKKDHFAFDLKYLSKAHFNWDGQKDERGRHLLQQLGTEVGRAFCQNIWLIKFCNRHGLRVPGGDVLPNNSQSLERRLMLGQYWYNHAKAALGCCGQSCGQCDVKTNGSSNSVDKARLLALSEFGWDGEADDKGDQLIANIEKLANDYDSVHWNATGADFEAFISTTLKKHDEEKAALANAQTGGMEKLVVPDCRFPNELSTLVDNGFISVIVRRPGVQKMGHQSETALDDATFHVTVNNDGSLEDLARKTAELMRMALSGELAAAAAAGTAIFL